MVCCIWFGCANSIIPQRNPRRKWRLSRLARRKNWRSQPPRSRAHQCRWNDWVWWSSTIRLEVCRRCRAARGLVVVETCWRNFLIEIPQLQVVPPSTTHWQALSPRLWLTLLLFFRFAGRHTRPFGSASQQLQCGIAEGCATAWEHWEQCFEGGYTALGARN